MADSFKNKTNAYETMEKTFNGFKVALIPLAFLILIPIIPMPGILLGLGAVFAGRVYSKKFKKFSDKLIGNVFNLTIKALSLIPFVSKLIYTKGKNIKNSPRSLKKSVLERINEALSIRESNNFDLKTLGEYNEYLEEYDVEQIKKDIKKVKQNVTKEEFDKFMDKVIISENCKELYVPEAEAIKRRKREVANKGGFDELDKWIKKNKDPIIYEGIQHPELKNYMVDAWHDLLEDEMENLNYVPIDQIKTGAFKISVDRLAPYLIDSITPKAQQMIQDGKIRGKSGPNQSGR